MRESTFIQLGHVAALAHKNLPSPSTENYFLIFERLKEDYRRDVNEPEDDSEGELGKDRQPREL